MLPYWTYPFNLDLQSNRVPYEKGDFVVFVSPLPSGNTTLLVGKYVNKGTKTVSGTSGNEIEYVEIRLGTGNTIQVDKNFIFALSEKELIESALSITLKGLNFEMRQMACLQFAEWHTINTEVRTLMQHLCPTEEICKFTGQKPEYIQDIIDRIISGNLEGIKPNPNAVNSPTPQSKPTIHKVPKSSFNVSEQS